MEAGTREWLESFLGGGSVYEADAKHVLREHDRLDAEVRDLKARLKAARRAAQANEPWMDSVPVIERVTDLRRNWRKP